MNSICCAFTCASPVRIIPDPEPRLPGKAFIASGQGASWEAQFVSLENKIRVRHYSPQTLKTYRGWTRKFQAFVRSKSPETLSTDDVKAYLTYLAVKRNVSASTQNQASNSLLFFYRHVLKREFGKIDRVVRAKRKPYIPVVLSRDEIDEVLKHLEPPYDLVVKLLYGCGLRLFECLKIRLNCLNFDARVLTQSLFFFNRKYREGGEENRRNRSGIGIPVGYG